jgi:hypothetical protein
MGFFINLLLAYWFYKIGSKRVMGGFTSFWWVFLVPVYGMFFVLASRRLDDEERNQELIEKYRPVKIKPVSN